MGASGEIKNEKTSRIAKFLGDISYPIYITHYPLIYTYTAYVLDNKMPITKSYPIAILVYVSSILIAYACLKWYDEPVRKWLSKRFINR
jgi:peptidoglycan/LPS O-acetylase OafA/YrhL